MNFTKATSILSLTAGIILFSACKKDTVTPTTPIVYTPEQNKSNLQQNGLDAMKEMDEAKNLESVKNATYFTDLLNKSNPFENGSPATLMPIKVMYALKNFKETGDQGAVYASLREAKSLDGDSTIDMAFNDVKGTYSWNKELNKWEKTEGNILVFQFPSNETKNTNNASFSIDFKAYTGKVYNEDLAGNTPEKVVAKLTVDNNVLVQFNFDATYNADGIPSYLEANLNIKPYNFNNKLTLSSSLVSHAFAFTHNTANIFAFGTSAKGDFTKAHLESLNDNTVSKVEDLTKIAASLNAYIQLMKVRLEGNADVNGLVNSITAKGGSDKMNKLDATEVLNKNFTLKAFYTDNLVNIAHTEFYVDKKQHTISVWNQTTQQWEQQVTEDEDVNIRLVFDDASKADLETYFGNGFEKLSDDLTTFLTDMETNYGSK